jgi:hypothetical protein
LILKTITSQMGKLRSRGTAQAPVGSNKFVMFNVTNISCLIIEVRIIMKLAVT